MGNQEVFLRGGRSTTRNVVPGSGRIWWTPSDIPAGFRGTAIFTEGEWTDDPNGKGIDSNWSNFLTFNSFRPEISELIFCHCDETLYALLVNLFSSAFRGKKNSSGHCSRLSGNIRYLSQCWLLSISQYGVMRPQWIKAKIWWRLNGQSFNSKYGVFEGTVSWRLSITWWYIFHMF